MDNRIGIIGGTPPSVTISGLPLPEKPYPTTIQLDEAHYVVVDASPFVDVNEVVADLRQQLHSASRPKSKKVENDESG